MLLRTFDDLTMVTRGAQLERAKNRQHSKQSTAVVVALPFPFRDQIVFEEFIFAVLLVQSLEHVLDAAVLRLFHKLVDVVLHDKHGTFKIRFVKYSLPGALQTTNTADGILGFASCLLPSMTLTAEIAMLRTDSRN